VAKVDCAEKAACIIGRTKARALKAESGSMAEDVESLRIFYIGRNYPLESEAKLPRRPKIHLK
jgi:hypothetical protein